MFLHRLLVGCCLQFWSENWCGLFNFKRAGVAWPAGDCPLAKTINGWGRDRHAMLVEPFGNLAVSPMLATQRKDGFAVRFQFAARPARAFIFGLLL